MAWIESAFQVLGAVRFVWRSIASLWRYLRPQRLPYQRNARRFLGESRLVFDFRVRFEFGTGRQSAGTSKRVVRTGRRVGGRSGNGA